MSKEDGAVYLLSYGAEVRVIPSGSGLTIDARSNIRAMRRVPTEAKTVTVEVGRGRGIAGDSFAGIKTLGDDAVGRPCDKVCGTNRNAEKGAKTTHSLLNRRLQGVVDLKRSKLR